jgi:hypothetical protein
MPYSISIIKCGHRCGLSKEKCCNCADNSKIAEEFKYYCTLCKTNKAEKKSQLSILSTIKEEKYTLGFFT